MPTEIEFRAATHVADANGARTGRRTLLGAIGASGGILLAQSMRLTDRAGARLPSAPRARIADDGGYRLSDHVKRYYQTTRA